MTKLEPSGAPQSVQATQVAGQRQPGHLSAPSPVRGALLAAAALHPYGMVQVGETVCSTKELNLGLEDRA